MGEDSGAQTGDGVGSYGLGNHFPVAERVEHRGVGGEESAPAHSDCGEYGDGVAVKDAGGIKSGQKAERGADSSESSHREGDEFHMLEAEEPFEHPVDFFGQPGQDGNTL